MIEAYQLVKKFEGFTAVQGISFAVQPGELMALLGPNGAGKTTTIRMISSILQPTSGWARVAGADIVTEADVVRRSIGMLTEQPGLYERMTGMEYLHFFGRLYGLSSEKIRSRGESLFARFGMPGTAHRRIGEYSKGMKQKVGLIRAMLHQPKVLLLDEPTSAMDPYSAKMVRDSIEEMRSDSRTIVLCTHNLPEAERLADRIAIISAGKIVAAGTVPELKKMLLGQPLMELQFDRPLNGELSQVEKLLNGRVQIEKIQGDKIRYRTAQPRRTNPELVAYLTGLGLGIVTLNEITQSLEEIYLSVVKERQEEIETRDWT